MATEEFWFNFIAAIGSLATAGAFIMLFVKDKDRQKQIDKLTKIASVLENQAESLNLQNELLSQQIDIFRNTSLLNEQNDEALRELKEIENKKMNLTVRPNLWLNGGSEEGFRGELKIDLNNKGETAYLKKFMLESDDVELHNEHLPYELDKGERRYIFMKAKGNKHVSGATYSLKIEFEDKLENKFIALINGKGASAKIENVSQV
jgi:hypothetical protein